MGTGVWTFTTTALPHAPVLAAVLTGGILPGYRPGPGSASGAC
ncbi:hypothetical protein ACBJ59_56480 [Nonomuraea sp. MTCD27]